MEIKEAIVSLLEKKHSVMKESFDKVLYKKAAERLQEMKVEVASEFFGKK